MAADELDKMKDHDLLVVAVTKIDGLHEKVSLVCETVEKHERQLTILQTEHKLRTQQSDCANVQAPAVLNKKQIAGISLPGIVALLLYIAEGISELLK